MTSLLRRPLVIVIGVVATWVLIRIMLELVFPFVPFQTNNSHLRIFLEMPFYYAVAWVCQVFAGENKLLGHWGMTVAVAILEGAILGCVAFVGLAIIRRWGRGGILQ